MYSIILTPLPITQENLNVPIDEGWVTAEEVCQGVEPGTVAVCGRARRSELNQTHGVTPTVTPWA